jgi:hypothetical protein
VKLTSQCIVRGKQWMCMRNLHAHKEGTSYLLRMGQ